MTSKYGHDLVDNVEKLIMKTNIPEETYKSFNKIKYRNTGN